MVDATEQNAGLHTEQQVQKYFESHLGWTVKKLDTGRLGGADFRICHGETCFLCEVKTIGSVRADFTEGPVVDRLLEDRDRRRTRIDRSQDENPDKTLLMRKEEWQWLRASDAEFRKKYGTRKRNTEAKFGDCFETPLRESLDNSSVSELPYDLRLDSDDLYVPSKAERARFVDWLVVQLAAIDRDDPVDRRWVPEDRPYAAPVYSAHYPLHEAADQHDTRHVIGVRLQRRLGSHDDEGLRVDVHGYGTLNVERVRSNVEKAISQLRAVASREERSRRFPRVVVLRFESGLHPLDDLQLLEEEVGTLFKKFDDLSAIAVLQWRPDGQAPPAEQGISAWFRFLGETPCVPFFIVYHNGWLSGATEGLDPDAFSDRWSTHTWVGPQ